MSVRRARRRGHPYTVIENHIINDRRIGWAAKGLLIYLLSKPDDWKVSVPALMNETAEAFSKTGRDGIYSLLRELTAAGYAKHTQTHGPDGKISGCDWAISEEPYTAETTPEQPQPTSAQPRTAETHALLSTERLPTTESTKPPSGAGELPFALPPVGERVASPEPAKVTAEALIETWNRHCSHVKKLTRPSAGTKQVILGRFKSEFESDLAQWERFCKRASIAPWLAGVNPTGWRLPNIEWLLRPAKLDALWANSYGGEAPRQAAPSQAPYAGYNPHLRPGDPDWRPSPGTI